MQPIDLIAREGYNVADFNRDLKAMFGTGKGLVRLHFRQGNRAPIDYLWNGKMFVRVWENKVVNGTGHG